VDSEEFDGCARPCRKAGKHTLVWGDCEHATEPEPRISIPVSEMADRIEKILRAVPVRLGPNALAALQCGETVCLSGGEYRDMAECPE
jgi:hypothetical protein